MISSISLGRKTEKKEEKPKEMKISEEKAIELLARMAKFMGFELVEIPRTARVDRHFCFSIGNARYTNNYFSAEKMLHLVLLSKDFLLVPGTWEFGVSLKDRYRNPFFKLSLEELELKLDVLYPKKSKEL